MRRMTIITVALALVAGALPATAGASTPLKRLAKRVSVLERANKNRLHENRALSAQLAADEDALNGTIGLLSCFYVIGVDDSLFTPPGMVDPVDALVVSPNQSAPTAWTAAIVPACVDTSSTAAAARSRAFRHFFSPKGLR